MGEVFAGRYELIDQIGEGGMGSVWRVRDLRRGRIVAAKVLRQADAGSLLRFMREQGMRIHHPGVVTPLGWAGEDDRVLFTMPIVEGGSASDLMRRYRALPPHYVAEVMRQLLAALAAVHSSGVVHRDIKPANVLLDATGVERPHVWLTDFGVAVATDAPRLTSRSVVMGTPGYLAPEQLRGADPDPRADLYAAGMVGLQMLTGHRPQPQPRTDGLDLPPRPDGTPEALWSLLAALAAPDVERRPAGAARAAEQLGGPEAAWLPQHDIVVHSTMPPLAGVAEGEFLRPGAPVDPTSAGGMADRRTPDRSKPSSRSPIAVLTAAPLVAAAVVALMIWAPWAGGGDTQPGQAVKGGTCTWQDVGTFEPDASGLRLECTYSQGRYVWAEPRG